jgi:heat shock protein HslJ/chitodextrinase
MKMRLNPIWVTLSLVLLLFLAMLLGACRLVTPTPEISQPIYRWGEVADRVWVLVGYGEALNPTVVEEGTVITAVFSSVDGQVTGSAGCNNYFTGYDASDTGGITIGGPIGATMMACETGMEQEAAYLDALETVSDWTLSEQGRLELSYSSGQPYEEKLIYAPGQTPLVGTTWRLVSFGDPEDLQELEEGTSVTAVFSPETDTTGTVAGNATCNSYTTGYTLDGDSISFGLVAGTMMMCPVGADQEVAYLAALESAQTYQIFGPNMQITYEGGVLNFTSLNLPLENVLWQAVMVGDQMIPEGVEITALFTPGDDVDMGQVGGSTGCNSYNAAYETDSDLSTDPTTHYITIDSPMAMTMAMCPDDALAQLEQAYLAALETAESYEILGDQLVVHTEDGDIQYGANRQPLEGTYWVLISRGDIDDPQPPVEGSNFTAQFNRPPTLPSGTVVGETGCNQYNATFTANLSEIKINLPSKTNNEDCPWGVGNFEVEQEFFLGLNSATEYRIIGNVLQIPYGEGETRQALNFVASQPPVADTPLDLTPLANTSWYLHAFDNRAVVAGSQVTAGFIINSDGVTGEINGNGGCNDYKAPIGQNFAIGPIETTERGCDPVLMEQERIYLAALATAYSYSVAGDQLLIPTTNGVLVYKTQPPAKIRFWADDEVIQAGQCTMLHWDVENVQAVWVYPQGEPHQDYPATGQESREVCPQKTTTFEMRVQLTDGGIELRQVTVLVTPVEVSPPTARINGPTQGQTGQALTFDGGASSGQNPIVNYRWDFGDNTSAEGVRVDHKYNEPGSYNVALIVTDDRGLQGSSSLPIQIYPVVEVPEEPVARINGPTLAEVGQAVTFEGGASTSGVAITAYNWDLGDGNGATGPSVTHAYNQPGTYTAVLVITDELDRNNRANLSIQITPVVEAPIPPTAQITGPNQGQTGQTLTFDGGASSGQNPIVNYTWDFGDGTRAEGAQVSHVYNQPGGYTVALTVTDDQGLQGASSLPIQIYPVVEAPDLSDLEGKNWSLVEAATFDVEPITALFEGGIVSGFSGCNTYNANYQSDGSNLTISNLTTTQAVCDEAATTRENKYLANLSSVNGYVVQGDQLTLTGAQPLTFNKLVATPAATP